MKTIAALELDLATTPLGTASRVAESLDGTSVARRTVERLQRVTRLQGIHIVTPPEQVSAVRDLLHGTEAIAHPRQGPPAPHRQVTRIARKWSLNSWRGGLGGAAAMDEYIDTSAFAAVAQGESANAVLVLPAAAALVDPQLTDAMLEHAESIQDDIRVTFTAAPPGLTGSIFQTSILQELAQHGLAPSRTLAYLPDAPAPDMMFRPCCYQAPAAVRHAAGRLIADTRRSTERIARVLAQGADHGAENVGRWLIAECEGHVSPLPREVEIELTTLDQLETTLLRPRGAIVGKRGPIDLDLVRGVAAELAAYDDALVVLGGFGEPLMHPRWAEVIRILRNAGIFGIALRTNGLGIDAAAIEVILENQIDVVEVTLDAATDSTYTSVNGSGFLPEATANIERLIAARAARRQAAPLIVPQMTKCWETLDELDAFYDGWLRKCGYASLVGYNHFGGRLTDRSVVDMSPPVRHPCRRIMTRCTIAADGQVLLCDQDFACARPAGRLGEATLGEIWNGPALTTARGAHRAGEFPHVPLCADCVEWHRP